ncbi:hypothetical protein IQ07DRAFT_593643 [Pyrenochaeta sp. DS3sAY3a]|nr:hypothetical protein IQ07DRAFT_593643 [Pyrenochaeta sp. DS3sAY3a]
MRDSHATPRPIDGPVDGYAYDKREQTFKLQCLWYPIAMKAYDMLMFCVCAHLRDRHTLHRQGGHLRIRMDLYRMATRSRCKDPALDCDRLSITETVNNFAFQAWTGRRPDSR